MNCDIFDVLCLRANGQFCCYCDAGHEINFAAASAADDWSVQRVFESRGYRLARALFRRGCAPWGETCRRCVLFQPEAAFAHDRPAKRLRQVLFEPSFACALRCPSCPRATLAPTRAGPVFLAVEVWRQVLRSLRDEGYAVGLFLTTGLGDPLTHPRIEDLVASIREFFPTTPISINTHGNYRLADVFPRRVYPDRFLVSVDGLHQPSYEQYRINGDVARTLEFMREARQVPARRPAVEWKYILFRHNDSEDELIGAQRKAEALDLDSLQFVFTHTPEKSRRYTAANVHELPVVWRGTYPDATCHLRYRRAEPPALTPNDTAAQPGWPGTHVGRIHIDSCHAWSDRLLVRGWAMGHDGRSPRSIMIQLNDGTALAARTGLVREDVWHAHPGLANRTAGFDAMLARPAVLPAGRVTVFVTYEDAGGERCRFAVDYDLGCCPRAAARAAQSTPSLGDSESRKP